jgi:multicomponent Na+:H+ antiporter subunit D
MAVALAVAVPLVVAGALAAGNTVLPRRVVDAIGVAAAATVAILCATVLFREDGTVAYWFGGWAPRGGLALGVSFAVDRFGAGMAALIALLVTASLAFSWRYFDAVGSLFHVLMLLFLAAMVGVALTGDLFNFFVFFELMGVAAYVLTGYKVEDPGPLQGALNFAITNSVGGFAILIGIGLVYARTGALNMAQAGRALAHGTPDGLVTVAFVLLLVGLLTKAAIVPFHFWLDDAHAVAPAPVCALLSGVMVELGLLATARIYVTVFAGAFGGHADAIRAVLVSVGVLTAVVGAIMSLEQRHLKRLLAFSTIAHAGLFLIGVALLAPEALASVAVYVVGHAFLKASLFLGTGILFHRLGTVDEIALRGQGARLPITGVVFALSGLALAGAPPFAAALGSSLLDDAVSAAGLPLLRIVVAVTSVLTAGAVLRAAGRIFLGWGPPDEGGPAPIAEHQPETRGARGITPRVMVLPPLVLLACALLVGLTPGFGAKVAAAAASFQDRQAYAASVLDGEATPAVTPTPHVDGWHPSGVVTGIATSLGAVAVALIALSPRRLGRGSLLRRIGRPLLVGLRTVHNGHVGDYVTWLTVGMAVLGGTFALLLR